jgi:ferredoxin-NADP reductase
MESHYVKIKSLEKVTHDVVRVKTDKPLNYNFTPGQATEVAVNKAGWTQEKRPFTFTSLPEDDYLEFTIKVYSSHNGVTCQISKCNADDELILHDVWGTIAYKGEGVFIAGGAGVTPFISIFKQLQKLSKIGDNKLIFANKTKADIILADYFQKTLGRNFINILSEEMTVEYAHGRITGDFLSKHIKSNNQIFYICGPEPMMDAVEEQLMSLKVSPISIVKEQF